MVDQPATGAPLVPPVLAGIEGPAGSRPKLSRKRARSAARRGALAGRSVEAWLLLLPSVVLFATFTHIPIVSTLIDSFYSTPKVNRPARRATNDRMAAQAACR